MTRAELNYEQMIEKHIKVLGCTREEAIDIIETDKIIDKTDGGRTKYDLTEEQEKDAMKYVRVDERKSKSANSKRGKVRAENPTKSGIIAEIAEYLTENCGFSCENVVITNKERQISFAIADEKFELTLVQKRKPKN